MESMKTEPSQKLSRGPGIDLLTTLLGKKSSTPRNEETKDPKMEEMKTEMCIYWLSRVGLTTTRAQTQKFEVAFKSALDATSSMKEL